MDSNKTTPIQIARLSNIIYSSREVVMLALDNVYHTIGKFILADYTNELGEVDTILVIGKLNGTGRNAYSVISTAGDFVVNKIEIPDVSQVGHQNPNIPNGEVYLAKRKIDLEDEESEEDWFLVSCPENERVWEIIDRSRIFRNLDDGYIWFYIKETRTLKREDDFLTSQETINIVEQNLEYFQPPKLVLDFDFPENTVEGDSYNYYLPELNPAVIENPTFTARLYNYEGEDVTEKYIISLDGPEELTYENGRYTVWGRFEGDFTLPLRATRNAVVTRIEPKVWFPVTIYYGSCIISDLDLSIVTRTIKSKLIYHDFKTIDLDYKLGDENNVPENSILILPTTGFDQFYHIYDDNGLDYINDYNYLITFNYMGLQYQAYVKKDPVIQDSLKQKFTYLNECIDLPNSEWIRELDKEDYYTKEQIDAMYPRITIDGNKITIGDREFRLEPWIDTADYYIGIAGMTREVFYSKTKEQLLATATPYTVQATPSYTHEYTEDEYGLVVFYIILKYNVSIESGDYRSGNLLTPYTPADFTDPTYFDLQYGSIAINGASYRVIGVRGVTFSDEGNMITLNLIKH